MNTKQTSAKIKKIRENYLRMRTEFFKDVSDEELWHRKRNVGFVSIPRCITFISIVMDELANTKISPTYLALWCHTFDESLVIINDQEAMAFESGFTGSRAINTWKTRMKELVDLGFIKAAPGRSGTYNYILILNPYKIIRQHREQEKITTGPSYNALFDRALEVGAADDLQNE